MSKLYDTLLLLHNFINQFTESTIANEYSLSFCKRKLCSNNARVLLGALRKERTFFIWEKLNVGRYVKNNQNYHCNYVGYYTAYLSNFHYKYRF